MGGRLVRTDRRNRLVDLHDQISERFEDGDRLVYLGNYLGRGAAVRETIDELIDFRRRVLARRGGFACDISLPARRSGRNAAQAAAVAIRAQPRRSPAWMVKAGIEPTVRAYGGDLRQGLAAARDGPRTITRWTSSLRNAINAAPGHTMLFSALRHAAFSDEGGVLFVHAAVDPMRPLAAQGDAFWWGGYDILDLADAVRQFSARRQRL